MQKLIMWTCIMAVISVSSTATIFVTNENVTVTNDTLNITEGINATTNFLLYNTTLVNDSTINNGTGNVTEYWPVVFNISNNQSQPISQVNLSINNTLQGWQENATPNSSGKYQTHLPGRTWRLNTETQHNTTVAYYRADSELYTHNFNVTGYQYVNVTLNWFLLIGGTLFFVGLTGLLFLTTNTELGLNHKRVLEPLALVLTPWGCVLLGAMMINVGEVASISTDVQANLATFYTILVYTAGFITTYTAAYYVHKTWVTLQTRAIQNEEE